MQQVLLRGGRDQRAGQDVHQGCQQAPERAALGAVRAGPRGQSRHGDQPGLPDAKRRHVHLRAAQARVERVLRQALGVGGRHPHGAPRVSPLTHSHTHTHSHSLTHTLTQPSLVVTPYQAIQPSAPHEQTPAWARQTGSTPRAHPVW